MKKSFYFICYCALAPLSNAMEIESTTDSMEIKESKNKCPYDLIQVQCATAIQNEQYEQAVKCLKEALNMDDPPFCRVFQLIIDGLAAARYISQMTLEDFDETDNLSQAFRDRLLKLSNKQLERVFQIIHAYSEKNPEFSLEELNKYYQTALAEQIMA